MAASASIAPPAASRNASSLTEAARGSPPVIVTLATRAASNRPMAPRSAAADMSSPAAVAETKQCEHRRSHRSVILSSAFRRPGSGPERK